MPKLTNPTNLIKDLGGTHVWCYNEANKNLFCKLCSFSGPIQRKSILISHTESKKHKKHVKLFEEGEKRVQRNLYFPPAIDNRESMFALDMTKALVASNIPLFKLEHPAFSSFLEKYTKCVMPSRTTLTKVMEIESKNMLERIREKLTSKQLFISIDETTDCTGRAMCIVLAGPLDGEFKGRPFLIDLTSITATNNQTIQQTVNTALFKVLGEDLNYQDIQLFLTDGAAYCVKAGKGLATMYPKLIHCLCLAHGLNRVAELVRYSYPKVDQLIAEVKKVFVKSALRRAEFAATCQIPLPPEPVLTR